MITSLHPINLTQKIGLKTNTHSSTLLFYHPGVVFANRLILRVFRSWSLIFFSISASVSVSKNGAQLSLSLGGLNGTSTVGRGASLNAYVRWCHDNWPLIEYAIAVTNSPPRPNSAHNFNANCSGLFSFSDMSHSTWSTKEVLPTWMLSLIMTRWSQDSSIIWGGSAGKASNCWRMAWAMAGTKVKGLRSKSSQRTSANCSGVIRLSGE